MLLLPPRSACVTPFTLLKGLIHLSHPSDPFRTSKAYFLLLLQPYSPFSSTPNAPYPKPRKPNSSLTVSDTPPPPPSPHVNTICTLLYNHNDTVTNLDSLLDEYKQKLSSCLVLEVVKNYKQLGRFKTLGFFSWAGTQMGFQFDDRLVEYMADFLGRRKLFDDMKCFLLTVLSHKGGVSPRTVSICVRFLGRDGRIREALSLFEEMELRFGCKFDNFVFNNLLYVLCKKETSGELMDKAVAVLRKIESPDCYSYGNVLVGLCKFGRFEEALQVFQEMSKVRLVPTRSTVNVLIGSLCSFSAKEGVMEEVPVATARRPFAIPVPSLVRKTGAIEPAIAIFWAVYDMELLPSAFVINKLISELCRLGRTSEAIELLKVAEKKKLSSVEEGYSVVIQALCQNFLVEEVAELFKRMLSQEMKLKLVTYNSIIYMLCEVGRLHDAKSVYNVMKKRRCNPDDSTFAALIHAYERAQKWEAAYDLFLEMLGFGCCPPHYIYSSVDSLLREHGQMGLSVKLEERYDAQVLLEHCKAGDLDSAYERFLSMLQKGYSLPLYVRDAFERTFRKYGKEQVARELLKKLD